MGRWASDARGRLEQAALTSYAERGFEATTAAQIAQQAGLTERTFFRYFADKREVLFGGSAALEEQMVLAAVQAAPGAGPLEAVAQAVLAAAAVLQERPERVRQRQAVIVASVELQERELIKLASLAAGLAGALRQRDVPEPAASLAAEAGVAVFKVAVQRWVASDGDSQLSTVVEESLEQLKAVTGGA